MENKWIILKSNVFSNILIAIICIPPSFAQRVGTLTLLYKYAKWIALFYAIAILLKKRGKMEKIDVFVYLWFAFTAFSVFINGTGMNGWFSKFYPYFSIYVISRYRFKKNASDYLKTLSCVFLILIVGNFLTWIWPGIKPVDDLGEELFLLGIRTRITDVLYIGIMISIITMTLNKKKSIWKIIFLLILISGVWFTVGEWVSTCIVGLIIMGILFVIFNRKKVDFYKYEIPLIIGAAILFYLVVFARFQENFSWLIENFLGEDLSLTGRTAIWDSLISQMDGLKWVFGNGLGENTGFTIGMRLTSAAHSQYLQIIYNYGIVGLIIFIFLPVLSIKKYSRISDPKISMYLVITLFVVLITGITEITCDTSYFYILLSMFASMDSIQIKEKCGEQQIE